MILPTLVTTIFWILYFGPGQWPSHPLWPRTANILFFFSGTTPNATTAHKIQGSTVPDPSKVLIDLSSVFEPAQAYVMLSRVQCIDQVYIHKDLDERKIRTSKVGLEEHERLKDISLNQNLAHSIRLKRNTLIFHKASTILLFLLLIPIYILQ